MMTTAASGDFVVTGFYTPNYSDVARTFISTLDAHRIPHKLYAVEPLGGTWLAQTLRKPEITLQALDEYPGRPVILMDVDCSVHGSLAPLLEGGGDIALLVRARNPAGQRIGTTSSRVVVVSPTPGARVLIEAWRKKCESAIEALMRRQHGRRAWDRDLDVGNDELLLFEAIAETPDVTLRMLPMAYAGAAAGACPDQLVTHESARDAKQPPTFAMEFKRWRRKLGAPFLSKYRNPPQRMKRRPLP